MRMPKTNQKSALKYYDGKKLIFLLMLFGVLSIIATFIPHNNSLYGSQLYYSNLIPLIYGIILLIFCFLYYRSRNNYLIGAIFLISAFVFLLLSYFNGGCNWTTNFSESLGASSTILQIISILSAIISAVILNKIYPKSSGWMAAIIMIIILVGFFIGLPSFCPNPLLGSACVAQAGYLCQSPSYNHITGNIAVTIGQNTGTRWTTANIVFVPQGTATTNGGIPAISFISYPANITYGSTGLISGQTVNIVLPVGKQVYVGTPATGSIWVQYTTQGNQTASYTQIAAINIKAS